MAGDGGDATDRRASASDPFRRTGVQRPGVGDIVRQLGVVALVVVVWGGTFRFATGAPGGGANAVTSTVERTPRAGADTGVATRSAPGLEGGDRTEGPAGADDSEVGGGEGEAGPAEGEVRVATAPPAESTPTTAAPAAPAESPGDTAETEPPSGVASVPAPAPTDDPLRPTADDAWARALAESEDLPEVSFVADVMPIMERRCVKCHGAPRSDGTPRIEEGLDLRTWEAIMAGSTWGSVIEPGDPVGSYLLELVVEGDMPDDGPRLLPREIRILTAWIAAGAPGN